MKKTINALSKTKTVNAWLMNSRQPRILHVFDIACNLINKHGEVLSIVTQQVGNGPFNLVVEDDVSFFANLNIESPVTVRDNQLKLGHSAINTENAELWDPHPDWEKLHGKRDEIVCRLGSIQMPSYQSSIPAPLLSAFTTSIVSTDVPSAIGASKKLAGLGIGLTPSGDDIIMGAIYAAWIIHPPEAASILAKEVAVAAAPSTTSLSAAWIKAAGKGEAGALWHEFFDALIVDDKLHVQESIDIILSIGETSGADALTGFLKTIQAYMALLFRRDATSSGE